MNYVNYRRLKSDQHLVMKVDCVVCVCDRESDVCVCRRKISHGCRLITVRLELEYCIGYNPNLELYRVDAIFCDEGWIDFKLFIFRSVFVGF